MCYESHRKNAKVNAWLKGEITGLKAGVRLIAAIRNHLLAEANFKCTECGWGKTNPYSKKVPLEIDHIDGNSENCSPSNLKVLCPNCHSLTPTYKALNSGKANKKRLEYSRLSK